MRRLVLCLVVLLPAVPAASLALPTLCDGADDAGSGRDSTRTHPVAVAPGRHEGCIRAFTDDGTDWYEISTAAGERIAATLEWPDCKRVYVALHRVLDDGSLEQGATFSASNGCPQWTVGSLTLSHPARYRVEVQFRNEAQGNPYTLTVQRGDYLAATCVPADDLGTGTDASDANLIPLIVDGPRARGCVDHVDDFDLFSVEAVDTAPLRFDLRLTGVCDYFFLQVSQRADDELLLLDYVESWECTDVLMVFAPPRPGAYEVLLYPVKWVQPFHVEYDVLLETGFAHGACGPQNDAGSGRDAAPASPIPVGPGDSFLGCVDETDIRDVYRIDVAAGDLLRVRVEPTHECVTPFAGMDQDGNGYPDSLVRYGCGGTLSYSAREAATWHFHTYLDTRYGPEYGHPHRLTFTRCEGAPPLLPGAVACEVGRAVEGLPQASSRASDSRCEWGNGDVRVRPTVCGRA